MRGEDDLVVKGDFTGAGSPPHARGRRLDDVEAESAERITPACAGKTLPIRARRRSFADHPRMRGEDHCRGRLVDGRAGSPPHARGRLSRPPSTNGGSGITPACAGKTRGLGRESDRRADHPRMRGEDKARNM